MKPTILIQLDTDPQPSVFDGVVAVDSGVDHLFRHGGVDARRASATSSTGRCSPGGRPTCTGRRCSSAGRTSRRARRCSTAVKATFFAHFRVSVLLRRQRLQHDGRGGGPGRAGGGGRHARRRPAPPCWRATGPVGQRVARLLARLGATVAIGSRQLDRAREAAEALAQVTGKPIARRSPRPSPTRSPRSLEGVAVVIAAGAAGAVLLPASGPRAGCRA